MPNEDQPLQDPPSLCQGCRERDKTAMGEDPNWTIRDGHLLLTAWYWSVLGENLSNFPGGH